MKKYMFTTLIFSVFTNCAVLLASGPETLPAVEQSKLERVAAALPAEAAAKPKKARRILMLWKCEGYFHEAIPLAAKTIEMLGEKTGAYETVVPATQAGQMDYLTSEKLAEFDAILFNNSSGMNPTPSQRQAIMDFIESGRGIVGIHAATDNFSKWPGGARMMGGLFTNHPWNENVPVKIDDGNHELTKMFPSDGFVVKDEIYQFNSGYYSRANQRVLLSLDYAKMGDKGERDDDDYAISWVKRVGDGRLFYCSFGHEDHIYWNAAILRHYLAGIQFALGDLPANTDPNPLAPAQ